MQPESSNKRQTVLRILRREEKESSMGRVKAISDLVNDGAECAVIGTVLDKPEAFYTLAEIVQPEDFGRLNNGVMWKAFAELVVTNQKIDLVTLWEELQKPVYGMTQYHNGADGQARYDQDIARYYRAASTPDRAVDYAKIVLESAVRIRHIHMTLDIEKLAFDKSKPLEIMVAEAGAVLFEAGRRSITSPTDIASLVSAYHDNLLNGDRPHLIPLGLPNHDDETGGIGRGEVSILAGAAGMGKTTLALSLILNMARTQRVVLFSLEMSRDEIINKLISMITGMPLRVMQNRNFTEAQRGLWFDALNIIAALNLDIIDDCPMLTPAQFRTRMLRLMHQKGAIDVAVIDGLWLMNSDVQHRERHHEVNDITRQLAAFVRQHPVAMLLLHQYKGEVSRRTDPTPRLDDLAEATAVHRNVQYALGLHNPNYYDSEAEADHRLFVLKARNKDVQHGANYGIHWNTEYRRYEGMSNASLND
jgi:replicative DNA helicase